MLRLGLECVLDVDICVTAAFTALPDRFGNGPQFFLGNVPSQLWQVLHSTQSCLSYTNLVLSSGINLVLSRTMGSAFCQMIPRSLLCLIGQKLSAPTLAGLALQRMMCQLIE